MIWFLDDFSRKRHLEYIGDTTTVLPEFPTTNPSSLLLPGGIDEEDIELFEEAYRNHCEEIVDTVVNLQVLINETRIIYFSSDYSCLLFSLMIYNSFGFDGGNWQVMSWKVEVLQKKKCFLFSQWTKYQIGFINVIPFFIKT